MFHGFCLYYNRLENHSQWDKFTRFRSFLCAFFTVDIVVYNILFAIKYKISRKCNIHPNSMPKIHKSFQNGYNIVLFMQQISLYRKCPFFPGSFAQNVHFREKPGIFFIFHFSLCSRRTRPRGRVGSRSCAHACPCSPYRSVWTRGVCRS